MSFEQKTWQNKDSNGNIPAGAPRFDADNMNRIESGIDYNKNLVDILNDLVSKINSCYVKTCDVTNVIHTITGDGTTWIATEDCWISLYMETLYWGNSAAVTVDGVTVMKIKPYGEAVSNHRANPNATFPPFFIKKGAVVKLVLEHPSSSVSASVKCYGCLL